MAQLDSSLVIAPFGEVNVFDEPDGPRVVATILMKPRVEGAQTGLAIDGSNSMSKHFGAHVPKLFRAPGSNVVQQVARPMAKYLAEFDTDGQTTVIYWACGTGGGEIEILGDMDAGQAQSFDFEEPKRFGTGTRLLPALRYFAEERFRDAPWGIYIFITDGRIEDLDEVKQFSLRIGRELAGGRRKFLKLVLIGLGQEIDEAQMVELDDLDYGGLRTPEGDEVDLWDHTTAGEMKSFDDIFKEVVSENTILIPSATITDSNGRAVRPHRRASYADGLPALIEFSMSPGSHSFTVALPGGQSFTQPVPTAGGARPGINLAKPA